MAFSVVTVVGARPQFIKSAALSMEFSQSSLIEESILHTGQHFDDKMSDIFFRELRLPSPEWFLEAGGLSHGAMTGKCLTEIEAILEQKKPDMVVVFGDTNSTLAGALAAIKLRIPVAHVEAGLRSNNFYQPEEINRIMTDSISELLFCPTHAAKLNLERESARGKLIVTGDIMYDSCNLAKSINIDSGTTGKKSEKYGVLTLHRQENVDDKARLLQILNYVKDSAAGLDILFPVHPRTLKRIAEFGIDLKQYSLIEPLGYVEMIDLVENAELVFTDSGGLQKEAYFCRTPCITLRDETEWRETIDAGWNRLWTTPDFLDRKETNAFGNGTAAKQIVKSIEDYCLSSQGTEA